MLDSTTPTTTTDRGLGKRKAAFYAVTGPAPNCGPGDYALALAFLHKIEAAIVQGGWTPYETNRLKKMQKRWARRAFGKDPRFDLVGTRDGRLAEHVEHTLRPRIAKMRDEETRLNRRGRLQDQRSNPERRWINADLPTREAKGAGADLDSDSDVWEPEAGEMNLPAAPPARQYLIPGQDTKGHAHRIYCRVMPAHFRALKAIESSKQFGFRTVGDIMRWCVDFGVRELVARSKVPVAKSALAQVDAIREVLLDEQYYLEFPTLFEQMTTTINRHLSAGAETEAVRLIAIVRHQIEQMAEPYWREKFMAELMRHYASYIDGTRAQAADFGGDA